MSDIESLSFMTFCSYTRRIFNDFLDINIVIYLYTKQWEYSNNTIQVNFILSKKYLNNQTHIKLKDIIDDYVNKRILSDTDVNSKSFMASYVDDKNKECYFTKFTNEKKIVRIDLCYKSNKIQYDPINYIPCVDVIIQKDAYLSIRICESSNLDKILYKNIFISKDSVLYTALMEILKELNLILSGLFITFEHRNYICTPQTILYFNQLKKNHEYYSINVWTIRK